MQVISMNAKPRDYNYKNKQRCQTNEPVPEKTPIVDLLSM